MSSKKTELTVVSATTKKKVRHVASRYMQAAQSCSKSSTGSILSVASNSHPSGSETLGVSPVLRKESQESRNKKHITSTPNSFDGVAGISEQNSSTAQLVPMFKEQCFLLSSVKPKHKAFSESNMPNIRPPHLPVPVLPVSRPVSEKLKGKKACNPDLIQEIEVKNLYAVHIQSAYLESRAKKSLQAREQSGLEQLHKLYCFIQILTKKLRLAETDFIILSYLELMQQILKPLEETLQMVSKEMLQFLGQYGEVSQATDSVRNNLPMSDIHVPSDSDLEADISCLLAKCEALLDAFTKHQPGITEFNNFSKLLSEIKNSVGNVEKETHRCSELLSAVDDTVITESCLKMGEIMSVQAKNS